MADSSIGWSRPFSAYMAWALYDPKCGYYANRLDQVGRRGDFFTSVSVGPLFGRLLAIRFVCEWERLGRPARWRISECGAHDGKLACDVLEALRSAAPDALAALEYVICEPLATLETAQRQRLGDFSQVVWHHGPEALAGDPLPGVVFGNELLDALPFDCVVWRDGKWLERRVAGSAVAGFAWCEEMIRDAGLAAAVAHLGGGFPDGYQTEIRTGWEDFLAPWLRQLCAGMMLWVDYGFEREDYHHPGRNRGTLRTFHQHRAGDDPFESPGRLDITAHVEFSSVMEAAGRLGCNDCTLTRQGVWLTRLATDWLLAQEGNPDRDALRQFQTLTHPGHLGGSFQALEIRVPARP